MQINSDLKVTPFSSNSHFWTPRGVYQCVCFSLFIFHLFLIFSFPGNNRKSKAFCPFLCIFILILFFLFLTKIQRKVPITSLFYWLNHSPMASSSHYSFSSHPGSPVGQDNIWLICTLFMILENVFVCICVCVSLNPCFG